MLGTWSVWTWGGGGIGSSLTFGCRMASSSLLNDYDLVLVDKEVCTFTFPTAATERELSYSLRKSRAREPPLCHTGRSAKSFINACLKIFQ